MPLSFAVDEHQDDHENDADDYARGKRKIEGEVLALVKEVARKLSKPRYLPSQEEQESQAGDDQADKNQNLAEAGKIKHRISPFGLTFVKEIAASLPLLAATAN